MTKEQYENGAIFKIKDGEMSVINQSESIPPSRKERRKQSKKPKLSKALSYNMNKSPLHIFNAGFED